MPSSETVGRGLVRGSVATNGGVIAVIAVALFFARPAIAIVPARPYALSARIQVRPTQGPAGIQIRVQGNDIPSGESDCGLWLEFEDATGTSTIIRSLPVGTTAFQTTAIIPGTAAPGPGMVSVMRRFFRPFCRSGVMSVASAPFTVTQRDLVRREGQS